MKVTPETLTDEMIREERRLASIPDENGETDDAIVIYCHLALRINATAYQRDHAKRLICYAINARGAKP